MAKHPVDLFMDSAERNLLTIFFKRVNIVRKRTYLDNIYIYHSCKCKKYIFLRKCNTFYGYGNEIKFCIVLKAFLIGICYLARYNVWKIVRA